MEGRILSTDDARETGLETASALSKSPSVPTAAQTDWPQARLLLWPMHGLWGRSS